MTTINESFNTADGDTLGPDLSWTELSGDTDIVSNAAQVQTTPSVARADSDLSSTDHYAEAVVSALTADSSSAITAGPLCRKDSTATVTFYHARLSRTNAPLDVVQLYKFVAGTATQLGSSITVTVSLPHTVRVEANGTTIKCYFDGVEKISVTDSAISTGTRTGIRATKPNVTKPSVDSFAASDLSSSITGDAAITEANDTLSAAGTLAIAAASSITEANDTLSSAGALAIAAAASITEENDGLSSAGGGNGTITGDAALTEANDTLASAGSLAIVGAAAITEENDDLDSADPVVPAESAGGWYPGAYAPIHGGRRRREHDALTIVEIDWLGRPVAHNSNWGSAVTIIDLDRLGRPRIGPHDLRGVVLAPIAADDLLAARAKRFASEAEWLIRLLRRNKETEDA